MNRLRAIALFVLPCGLLFAQGQLVVDRGLPKANLNNSAGVESRSNVRWSMYEEGFVGDDLVIGDRGERWVIDKLRMWTVPGGKTGVPNYLGDFYEDVRLYFGREKGGVSPVATGLFELNSNQTSNADIAIAPAAEEPAFSYDDFGTTVRVWQVDFNNLNLAVRGGEKYLFSAFGLGRQIALEPDRTYPWFNHASNMVFGGAKSDGADNRMRLFRASGKADGVYFSEEKDWNKSSDLNVQVWAHRAP